MDDKETLSITYLSIASDGSVFYSGDRGGVGVAGKVNPDGMPAWENQVGAGAGISTSCAVTPAGDVVFVGGSSGQVAGNPPDVAGGPWLAHYGSDGTKLSLKQYNKQYANVIGPRPSSSLLVDASNNIYALAGDAMKVSASGDILSFVPHDDSPTNKFGGKRFYPASATSAGDAFYVAANVLSKFDTSLKRLVDMEFEAPRMKVIDTVEGVIWTGTFAPGTSSNLYVDASSSGAIYLASNYSNTYKNGAVPRPATQPIFVGRYNADGSRVWFKEIVTRPPVAGQIDAGIVAGIVSDDTTNSVVVFARGSAMAANFLFKLNAVDGTVIQSP